MVQPLKGHPTGHGGIPHHCNVLPAGIPRELGGHGHPQNCGDRCGTVASPKIIIGALAAFWEAAYATQLAVTVEYLLPAGEDLMPIGLVAHIPSEFVPGRIEDI